MKIMELKKYLMKYIYIKRIKRHLLINTRMKKSVKELRMKIEKMMELKEIFNQIYI